MNKVKLILVALGVFTIKFHLASSMKDEAVVPKINRNKILYEQLNQAWQDLDYEQMISTIHSAKTSNELQALNFAMGLVYNDKDLKKRPMHYINFTINFEIELFTLVHKLKDAIPISEYMLNNTTEQLESYNLAYWHLLPISEMKKLVLNKNKEAILQKCRTQDALKLIEHNLKVIYSMKTLEEKLKQKEYLAFEHKLKISFQKRKSYLIERDKIFDEIHNGFIKRENKREKEFALWKKKMLEEFEWLDVLLSEKK